MDRASFTGGLLTLLALPVTAPQATRPFNLLILGDSIAWGQGLLPEHRWRTLLLEKLRARLGRDVRELAPQVHSGATIGIGDRNQIDEPGLYSPGVYPPGGEKPTLLGADPYDGELPSATPTVLAQVDTLEALDPDTPIDLVVVSAGINDVRIARLLDPLVADKFIRELIDLHCRRHLTALLDRIRVRCVNQNPACRVAVLSYFEMISPDSTGVPSVYNFVSAMFSAPPRNAAERRDKRVLQSAVQAADTATQAVTEATPTPAPGPVASGPPPTFAQLPRLIRDVIAAAQRFYAESQKAIDAAVADANRAPFVPAFTHVTPRIAQSQALWVVPPNASSLWVVDVAEHRPPQPTDEVRNYRLPLCAKLYARSSESLNECDVASIGHPDLIGASDGYFEAIWAALAPMLGIT
jgi:lysophospholipase L1-like esterase